MTTDETQLPTLSPSRRAELVSGFQAAFAAMPDRFFSAPGRVEIGGNHTDHQRGHVLAAAIHLDTVAAVKVQNSHQIRIQSAGYPLCVVDLQRLKPIPGDLHTTAALVRGVVARFVQLGCHVGGFDAYVTSTVLPGSGLSSSAAFEVLLGTILNGLFGDGKWTGLEIAMAGQYAEQVHFGKPCGLMDQMASAVGSLVTMDFLDPQKPVVRPVAFDFSACDHALCIVDSGATHAGLTEEYAAITQALTLLCGFFKKKGLRQVPETEFYAALPTLRHLFGDRAVLRAIHFYQEDKRVLEQVAALEAGDFGQFLKLVKQSGYSSYMYLQNIIPAGAIAHQEMGIALALCEHYLAGRGAYRVHGGGFAGTILAIVPLDRLESFQSGIHDALGQGACHILSIRPWGGIEILEG